MGPWPARLGTRTGYPMKGFEVMHHVLGLVLVFVRGIRLRVRVRR